MPPVSDKAELRDVLEQLYVKYNRFENIPPDPLQFVYRYSVFEDKEIAGLLSACLAYGRVQQIEKSLIRLFDIMEGAPFKFVMSFDYSGRQKLASFKHRFNTGDDIANLLEVLKKVYTEFGSLKNCFVQAMVEEVFLEETLNNFCRSLLGLHLSSGKSADSKGLSYLLPLPEKGSACKRLNMFMKWMVRSDDVDPGLWSDSVDKARLIVPMDVHMGRLCKIIGLYSSRSVNWRTAIEVTRGFAGLEPDDPVKYDFCLSRIGIVENCSGKPRPQCLECELKGYCRQA